MRLKLWGFPLPMVAGSQRLMTLAEKEEKIYALPRVSEAVVRSFPLTIEEEAQLTECCCERWPSDFAPGVQIKCLGEDTILWAWDVGGRSKRVREIRHYEVLGTEYVAEIDEDLGAELSLSQDTLGELETELGSLMSHWSPHRDQADYAASIGVRWARMCVFCKERGNNHLGDRGDVVSHSFNCFGVRLQKELGKRA